MNYQLEMLLTDQPAVLERVLQTTRYRGFRVDSMQMQPASKQMKVSMLVSGKHPISMLTSQLNKLYDLASLECQAQLVQSGEQQSTQAQPLPKTA
ncbi:acetolactate synthase 2 small subunit [Bowmanella pacifica]|uniref:Acetolactate synthase n=1 Tax=Bowmanella pacifica TaxID=502051 RepID=A0A918DI52_9ALTE|nr:acetolactate synthase 2 small subunit [Bowmanella pacifica]GGO66529.1 hypothetical protein GCM10010982_10930 [Bowmanella pacifica]